MKLDERFTKMCGQIQTLIAIAVIPQAFLCFFNNAFPFIALNIFGYFIIYTYLNWIK